MTFTQQLSDDFDNAEGVERALFGIALAIENLAYQVKYLGNGNATTQMGAIEAFSAHLGQKLDRVADAIESVAL